MAARRAERLVNLVICLLSTRQYLTAEQIREAVPGYESPSDEAFKRTFERDKAELRDLGVPLEVGHNSIFDTDDGYRITRREYELPAFELDPAEAAAVGLAARLWQSATLGAPARSALIKLRAGGAEVDAAGTPGAVPHVDASDPTLPALVEAARIARPVQFDYLKSGSLDPQRRTVEPWGVLSWRRRWYVVGQDRDRDDARSFRLSRIIGDVTAFGVAGAFVRPDGVDLLAYVSGRGPDETFEAQVRVAGAGAGALRRMAGATEGDVLRIEYTDVHRMARLIAGAGVSAQALGPPDLVATVIERMQAVRG